MPYGAYYPIFKFISSAATNRIRCRCNPTGTPTNFAREQQDDSTNEENPTLVTDQSSESNSDSDKKGSILRRVGNFLINAFALVILVFSVVFSIVLTYLVVTSN